MRDPGRSGGRRVAALLLVAGLGAAAGDAAGQQSMPGEAELLLEASRQESAGDLDGAEATLTRVLASRASSLPALLSLERVLRIQGRLAGLVGPVEAALARDPGSPILNELLVRTLSELDREAELEAAAEAWLQSAPGTEVPYREVAAVWQERGAYDRARATLERGRDAVDRPDALALELGDLYAELGEPERAAEEWARAVDDRGRGLSQVRRRTRALPDAGRSVLPGLVDRLGAGDPSAARTRAALDLAVEAGLLEPARELADRALPALSPDERQQLLEDMGRRADAAGRSVLAYWAYGRLLEAEDHGPRPRGGGWDTESFPTAAERDGRRAAIRSRVAQLARELGDTAAASAAWGATEPGPAPGSAAHRAAAATRVELLAPRDPDAAREALERFRSEHPGADATDRLTAVVAEAFVARGREEDAALLLAGERGPRSTLVRARLALASGETERARTAYLEAAAGLRGAAATTALERVTLVGRLSSEGAVLLADALRAIDGGEVGAAIDGVVEALPGLDRSDGAPLLAFMAAAADDAGLSEDATELRERIVAEYPRSPEAPEALLALGRALGDDPTRRGQAREWLERLVIEYPRSALVPQARRALERIRQEQGA